MDAIDFLRGDHPLIQWLSEEYEELPPRAHDARTHVIDQFRLEVELHLAVSEQLLYPAVRTWLPALDDLVLDGAGANRAIGLLSTEVGRLGAVNPGYEPKVEALVRMVRRHLAVEKELLLPAVEAGMDHDALANLGARMSNLRAVLAADPRTDQMGRPTAVLSAAGALVIEAANRVIEAVSTKQLTIDRPRS